VRPSALALPKNAVCLATKVAKNKAKVTFLLFSVKHIGLIFRVFLLLIVTAGVTIRS
jgi:hypothetical protein